MQMHYATQVRTKYLVLHNYYLLHACYQLSTNKVHMCKFLYASMNMSDCIQLDKMQGTLPQPLRHLRGKEIYLCDPFEGSGTIKDVMTARFPWLKYVGNDRRTRGFNTMNPVCNSAIRFQQGNVIYVMSPPFGILDLVLAYFDSLKYIVLIVQIPALFYTRNDIPRRHSLLGKCRDEGRAIMQEGGDMLFRGNCGQHRWIYVFKNAKTAGFVLSARDRGSFYRWIV